MVHPNKYTIKPCIFKYQFFQLVVHWKVAFIEVMAHWIIVWRRWLWIYDFVKVVASRIFLFIEVVEHLGFVFVEEVAHWIFVFLRWWRTRDDWARMPRAPWRQSHWASSSWSLRGPSRRSWSPALEPRLVVPIAKFHRTYSFRLFCCKCFSV